MVLGEKIPWLPILRLHAPMLLLVLVVSIGVAVAHEFYDVRLRVAALPFSIVGVALSIFLAFRNNASYDRYWEGRKLWGGLVNASRSFGRQVTTLIAAPAGEAAGLAEVKRALVHRQVAYVHALRSLLRGDDVAESLAALIAADERAAIAGLENPPVGLLQAHAYQLVALSERGWLSERRLQRLDETLTELTALQGGCERIKKTPIPLAYRFFTQAFVRAYCVLLPLAMIEQLGVVTCVASVAVAFVFFVLDRIGAIVEDPFTNNFNGLPLAAICRTIEIDLRRQLGETAVPAPLTPQEIHRGVARVLL